MFCSKTSCFFITVNGCNQRSHFYDVQKEYSEVTYDTDNSSSDITSEISFAVTEGGYMSGDSDSLYTNKIQNDKTCVQKRRTKQDLDNSRHSQLHSISDTDDGTTPLKSVRKAKVKPTKKSKNKPLCKNENSGATVTIISEDEAQKCQSWTDSGVSFSRTDQSRCDIISTSPAISDCFHVFSVVTDKTTKKQLFTKVSFNDNNSSLKEADAGDITTYESSMKETDGGDSTAQESVEQNTRSKTFNEAYFINKNKKLNLNCLEDSNRLSFATDKSSLTSVTGLSNSESSLASLGEATSVVYATSATSKQTDIECKVSSPFIIRKELEQAASAKETEIVNQLLRNVRALEFSSDIVCDNCENQSSLFQNESKNETVSTIAETQTCYHKIDDGNRSNCNVESRKKSKGFMSGFKKVKATFKPRFFIGKHYKDVSSDFSFEKSKVDQETQQQFKELTSRVIDKFEELQNAEVDEFKRLSVAASKLSLDNILKDDDDPLDYLSTRPHKQKTILQKLFRRSRSYSAEGVVKKSKHRNGFVRDSNRRASVRSIPDDFGKSVITNARQTKSLENIEKQCMPASPSDNKNLDWESYDDEQSRYMENNQIEQLSRIKSMTSLQEEKSIYSMRKSASTAPNTPLLMRSEQRSSASSAYLNCDCEDCLYNEYMDYVAFQRFRRTSGFSRYPFCRDACYCSNDFVPHRQCLPYRTNNVYTRTFLDPINQPIQIQRRLDFGTVHSNVIAPLSMTVEKERQAKNFKTSMYDHTFV